MKTTPAKSEYFHNLAVDRDDGLTCEICGTRMLQRQCKIRCPNCGYTRDCSDP
jgi:rubrerythrin